MRSTNSIRKLLLAVVAAGLSATLIYCTVEADESAPASAVDLRAAEEIAFSQFGEDGVIEKIFQIIEPGPKFSVEFGGERHIDLKESRHRKEIHLQSLIRNLE